MSGTGRHPEAGRLLGLEPVLYRDLPMMVAPAPADTEVAVWWPQPDEMPALTASWRDATATRLLHAVYLSEADGEPR
ncbi:hypothetical protein AB0B83_14890 [Micromonospora sp. NPDC049060]|uniref:hypothetical protein n=1 Tax=Micromonospora sp. NPDC049060 TaxID=3154828 RepID=UPI00340A94C9